MSTVSDALDALWGAVQRRTNTLRSKTQQIETMVLLHAKELEELRRKTLADSYKGVWDQDTAYERGALFTHAGGLWLCLQDAKGERPGKSASHRLIVKAGQGGDL